MRIMIGAATVSDAWCGRQARSQGVVPQGEADRLSQALVPAGRGGNRAPLAHRLALIEVVIGVAAVDPGDRIERAFGRVHLREPGEVVADLEDQVLGEVKLDSHGGADVEAVDLERRYGLRRGRAALDPEPAAVAQAPGILPLDAERSLP